MAYWRKIELEERATDDCWLVGWFMVFNSTLKGTTSLAALLRRHEVIYVCYLSLRWILFYCLFIYVLCWSRDLDLIFGVSFHFQQYFSYIMATSCSGGRSRREPSTMGKQLVNFITCGCESSAPFL